MMTKKEIQEIIGSIRKAEGDFINGILPKRLKESNFRVFFIDEKLLVLKSEKEDAYTLIINIRHELDQETGEFKMWISKPMYYADIDMNPDAKEEARMYTICMLEVLSNKTFYHTLRQRLEAFDNQMIQFKNDLENAIC